MGKLIRLITRKINEAASGLFRSLVYPFVRIYTELSSDSIMKQHTYMNKGSRLSGKNYLGRNVYLTNTEIGFGSYVAEGGRLIDTSIGRYCSIGPDISCAFGIHPTHDFVSTHPAFYSASGAEGFTYVDRTSFTEEKYVDAINKKRVVIGNDVWIGAGVTLLEGITIGDGAVIASGSLVNKDVEPYGIYGGIPVRKIGTRFDEATSEKLADSKWFDLPESRLREMAAEGLFNDAGSFLEWLEREGQ